MWPDLKFEGLIGSDVDLCILFAHIVIGILHFLPPTPYSKLQAQFQSMEVRNSCFAAFIDIFTPNTYVMVIVSDSTIRKL